MEEHLYSASQGDAFGSLVSPRVAHYEEISYHNTSSLNLAIINYNGTVTELPPECTQGLFGKAEVSISHRWMTGKTLNLDSKTVLMPGRIINIPIDTLTTYFQVYVKELNVVICLADRAHAISHPYACVDYARALNDVREELKDVTNNAPTITLVANDPFYKMAQDVVYGVMFGEVFEIPVTHHLEKTSVFSLYATVTYNGTVSTYVESLEPMISEKEPVDLVELHNELLLAITATRREAQRYLREHRRVTDQDVKEREKRIKAEVTEEFAIQITQLTNERDKLKIKLEAAEAERDRYKEQYNAIIADHRTQADIDDISAKRRISDNNVDISENKKKESEIKVKHLVLAAAIPTVIAAACKIIEVVLKSKTK